MKIEHQSPARLEIRQDMLWVALMILGVMTGIGLYALSTQQGRTLSGGQYLILGIPVAVGAVIAFVLMAMTQHISLDRNAGLVTIRRGWAFGKKATTYPLASVEGARVVPVRTRAGHQKPGLRPVLLIRVDDELQEISLVRIVTNWESNRAVVEVIRQWLAGNAASA